MKIGILGTRGIPNAYGGFEQFATHLSAGLKRKGHEVFVYNSSLHPYRAQQWNGVNIIHCRDWEDKLGAAGQFIYDFNCIEDARKRKFDILLQLGYTSNSIWHWRWPKDSVNIVNMDGLEWKRTQYSPATRRFLEKAEAWAATRADHLIADSTAIQTYIFERYNQQCTYIPYGAEIFDQPYSLLLGKFNLVPWQYYLVVCRMEPENSVETIIAGYLRSHQRYPLVIVGNNMNRFGRSWTRKYKNENIRFENFINDQETLNNLRFHSTLYFHGHTVGGTNPSLLEAMACNCNIAAHDNIFNRTVLTDNASYFSTSKDVGEIIDITLEEQVIRMRQEKNRQRIRTEYNWDKVIDRYEDLFLSALSSKTKDLLLFSNS